jgi:hypothetical protein
MKEKIGKQRMIKENKKKQRKRASAARRKLFSFVIKQDQKEGGLMIVAG